MPGTPYLVCLGRVDGHKGTTLLAAYFARYKERHPGPLRLVLAGPVVDAPPAHPDIDVVGPVSEADKWELLAGAAALVSPSPWEAFSLVVAEAWSARTPVLVNAGCAATVEHCRRSGGGVCASTATASSRWPSTGWSPTTASVAHSAGRGRAYVDARFRWPLVIDRYAAFVESVVARAGRRNGPSRDTGPAGDAGGDRFSRRGRGPAVGHRWPR